MKKHIIGQYILTLRSITIHRCKIISKVFRKFSSNSVTRASNILLIIHNAPSITQAVQNFQAKFSPFHTNPLSQSHSAIPLKHQTPPTAFPTSRYSQITQTPLYTRTQAHQRRKSRAALTGRLSRRGQKIRGRSWAVVSAISGFPARRATYLPACARPWRGRPTDDEWPELCTCESPSRAGSAPHKPRERVRPGALRFRLLYVCQLCMLCSRWELEQDEGLPAGPAI